MIRLHKMSLRILLPTLCLVLSCSWALNVEAMVPHHRDYFYVGGEYVTTASGETEMRNQMYVEKLHTPWNPSSKRYPLWNPSSKRYPLVLIHGKAMTGTNWLNTPDGRPGWASFFLAQGYTVYIVDHPARGRSAWHPGADSPSLKTHPAERVSRFFTATRDSGLWPQAALHSQWPGTGTPGDPTFDAFFASTVQFLADDAEAEARMRLAGAALLDRIGPAVLITHSQGGLYGWAMADARPGLVKAVVAVEPSGPPFRENRPFGSDSVRAWGMTSIPVQFHPPASSPDHIERAGGMSERPDRASCVRQAEPARQLPNLRDVPVLIEVGQASYHALYDHCSFEFLKQAGLRRVELLRLEDLGILGNGHLQFLELNNLDIARVLEKWIREASGEGVSSRGSSPPDQNVTTLDTDFATLVDEGTRCPMRD